MQAKAEARYIRVSAQKARLVVDLIRGKQAGAALNTLRAANKRIAPTVEKVLQSAIANAQNLNEDVDVDELIVSEAYVNEGPRQRRVRPAPMGRGFRYQKRTAHIVVQVAEHHRAAADRAAAAAAEAQASKGVKGAVRKARKAIEKRAKEAQKKK